MCESVSEAVDVGESDIVGVHVDVGVALEEDVNDRKRVNVAECEMVPANKESSRLPKSRH